MAIKFRIKQTGMRTIELHNTVNFDATALTYLSNSDGIAEATQAHRYLINATIGDLFSVSTIANTIATVVKSYYSFTDAEIEILLL